MPCSSDLPAAFRRQHDVINRRSEACRRLSDTIRYAGPDYDALDDEAIVKHRRAEQGMLVTLTERFKAWSYLGWMSSAGEHEQPRWNWP